MKSRPGSRIFGFCAAIACALLILTMGCQGPLNTTAVSLSDSKARSLFDVDQHSGKIAFLSDRTGTQRVWIKDLAIGAVVQLNTEGTPTSKPAWSYDGQYLAVTENVAGKDFLKIYDASGTFRLERTLTGFLNLSDPSWSPDGTKIVMTGQRDVKPGYPNPKSLLVLKFPSPYDFLGGNLSEEPLPGNGNIDVKYAALGPYSTRVYLVVDGNSTLFTHDLGVSNSLDPVTINQGTTPIVNAMYPTINGVGAVYYNQTNGAINRIFQNAQSEVTSFSYNMYAWQAVGNGWQEDLVVTERSPWPKKGHIWIWDPAPSYKFGAGANYPVMLDTRDSVYDRDNNSSNNGLASWWKPAPATYFDPAHVDSFLGALGKVQISARVFKIMNKKTGLVLGKDGGWISDIIPTAEKSQVWVFNQTFDGNYVMNDLASINSSTDVLMDVGSNQVFERPETYFQPYPNRPDYRLPTANTRWKLVSADPNTGYYFKIVGLQSGKVIQPVSAGVASPVELVTDTGSDLQQWQLIETTW